MLHLILRGLVAGFLIVSITEIAARWPRLAAVLLFVPIAIPIVFLTMYWHHGRLDSISRLSREALVLIPLSLPMFIPLAAAHRLHLSFWPALISSCILAAATISLYLWLAR